MRSHATGRGQGAAGKHCGDFTNRTPSVTSIIHEPCLLQTGQPLLPAACGRRVAPQETLPHAAGVLAVVGLGSQVAWLFEKQHLNGAMTMFVRLADLMPLKPPCRLQYGPSCRWPKKTRSRVDPMARTRNAGNGRLEKALAILHLLQRARQGRGRRAGQRRQLVAVGNGFQRRGGLNSGAFSYQPNVSTRQVRQLCRHKLPRRSCRVRATIREPTGLSRPRTLPGSSRRWQRSHRPLAGVRR